MGEQLAIGLDQEKCKNEHGTFCEPESKGVFTEVNEYMIKDTGAPHSKACII